MADRDVGAARSSSPSSQPRLERALLRVVLHLRLPRRRTPPAPAPRGPSPPSGPWASATVSSSNALGQALRATAARAASSGSVPSVRRPAWVPRSWCGLWHQSPCTHLRRPFVHCHGAPASRQSRRWTSATPSPPRPSPPRRAASPTRSRASRPRSRPGTPPTPAARFPRTRRAPMPRAPARSREAGVGLDAMLDELAGVVLDGSRLSAPGWTGFITTGAATGGAAAIAATAVAGGQRYTLHAFNDLEHRSLRWLAEACGLPAGLTASTPAAARRPTSSPSVRPARPRSSGAGSTSRRTGSRPAPAAGSTGRSWRTARSTGPRPCSAWAGAPWRRSRSMRTDASGSTSWRPRWPPMRATA